MTTSELEKLKYPIGRFERPETITPKILQDGISEIAAFPDRLKAQVSHLTAEQLDTPYRPGGWTIRQVIHHAADSHMNCLIRFKWALTEENPTIKFYYEDRWAQGDDNRTMPIEPTLRLLEGLHFRLAYLMRGLSEAQLRRTFVHPEHGKIFALDEVVCLYAWHGNHHLAHVTALKQSKSWA